MIIEKLVLKNFRGIREMELELDPNLNVLIGINGSGKSSVLDAIVELLAHPLRRICDQVRRLEKLSATDISYGHDSSACLIHASMEGLSQKDRSYKFIWGFHFGLRSKIQHPDFELTHDKSGQPGDERLAKHLQAGSSIPIVLLYSTDRALHHDSEREFRGKPDMHLSQDRKYTKESVYFHSLGSHKRFHWFLQWFKDREEIEVRRRLDIATNGHDALRLEGESPEGMDVQLEAVRKVIENFTGLKSPRFYGDPLRLVANKGDMQLPIACFSEGEKSLLAVVGDIARRLAIANPERDNPLEGSGVVMIDEVDLHLHPTWQRMIVPRLRETFPNIQFIVTTHSPQVLGEIHSENIVVLQDTPKGIEAARFSYEVHGMTSDQILEALMGSSERNEAVATAIREANKALEENNIALAKERLAWLEDNAKDIPKLERIAMRIRRKEAIGK